MEVIGSYHLHLRAVLLMTLAFGLAFSHALPANHLPPQAIETAAFEDTTPTNIQSASPQTTFFNMDQPSLLQGMFVGVALLIWFYIKVIATKRNEIKSTRDCLTDQKPYAMIVEDDPVSQRILTKTLSKLNYQPVVACDGQRALDLLSNHPWSIIFMDCQMPVKDGLTAASEIRAMGNVYQATPIIALSSNNARGFEKRCLAAGMNDYLCKPLSFGKIKSLIAKHNPDHAETTL